MRLQLALNVADLDEAVEFYTKMFGVGPAKTKPGYANFAIDQPPLKLVLFGAQARPARSTTSASRPRPPAEVDGRRGPPVGLGARDHRRGRHRVLLRREDRDLGPRPRRHPLGVVRQARRHRAAPERRDRHPHRAPAGAVAAPAEPRDARRRRRASRGLLAGPGGYRDGVVGDLLLRLRRPAPADGTRPRLEPRHPGRQRSRSP